MDKETLKKLVVKFKNSLGYLDKFTDDPNAILFTKGEIQELVYIHGEGEENILEDSLSSLATTYRRIPEQIGRFFISTYPLGRPPEAVVQNGFKYQVPVWFFDKEFSTLKTSTPLKQLEAEAKKYESERIAQPFISGGKKGSDLLDTLLDELKSPKAPSLRIILAPAGYGKTVLMASLYSKLKEKFVKEKQRQQLCMRPLIMLPGHIGRASDLNELINNFINSEYTFGDASIDTFKFWINNNFAVWLLDGVEELFIKNSELNTYKLLDEYIGAPDSVNPQIIIAIRKSLLATSSELKDYIKEWESEGVIKVYELNEWGDTEKKKYFEKNLTIQSIEKTNFITDILNSSTLNSICSVPYFSNLIAGLKNNDKMKIFSDKVELIEYVFENFCEREFNKGLDRDIFPVDNQRTILIDLAGEFFKGNTNDNIKNLLKDFVQIFTENLSDDLKEQQTNFFVRHAFLTETSKGIDFSHEIIKEYLQSLYLLDKLVTNNIENFDNKEIEYESFLLDCLIKKLPDNIDWNWVISNITQIPYNQSAEAIGFRNILKIITKSAHPNITGIIKNFLSHRNLSGIKFSDLNMNGFNFQNSNLESVTFERCNLESANFGGCTFKNTNFKDSKIKNAIIKGAHFISVDFNGKYMDDSKEIVRTFIQETGTQIEQRDISCQALINLVTILKKLTRKHKGDEMPIKFLLAVRCGGRIPADIVVDQLIKEKILLKSGDYVKINPNYYEYIKKFVDKPTPNLVKEIDIVLNRICPDYNYGCKHFYSGDNN